MSPDEEKAYRLLDLMIHLPQKEWQDKLAIGIQCSRLAEICGTSDDDVDATLSWLLRSSAIEVDMVLGGPGRAFERRVTKITSGGKALYQELKGRTGAKEKTTIKPTPDRASDHNPSEFSVASGENRDPLSRNPLTVFLCHSSGDKPSVRDLYHRLQADGFDPWLDEENLLPGQNWREEIPKAVRKSNVVIICLSKGATTKPGYVQKEIKEALDVADEQPEGAIFLIPAKLEECDIPDRLRNLHWVNLFENRGYGKLIKALRRRAEVLAERGQDLQARITLMPDVDSDDIDAVIRFLRERARPATDHFYQPGTNAGRLLSAIKHMLEMLLSRKDGLTLAEMEMRLNAADGIVNPAIFELMSNHFVDRVEEEGKTPFYRANLKEIKSALERMKHWLS